MAPISDILLLQSSSTALQSSTTDLDKSPQCYEEANILTRK